MKNKKLRRLKHLCYKYPFIFPWFGKFNVKEIKDSDTFKYYSNERKEIFKLLPEVFDSDIKSANFWCEIGRIRSKNKAYPYLKPIQSKRDNKNVRVGSGGSNINKIRFPKKKRKNAWKKFFKLFPTLNNKIK